MRFDLRREWPAVLLIASMFAASALLWPSAPERVPVHWGLSGEPDEHGPKAVGLLLVPFAAVIVYLSMLSVPHADASRLDRGRFPVSSPVLRAAIVALLAAIHAFALMWIFGGVRACREALLVLSDGGVRAMLARAERSRGGVPLR